MESALRDTWERYVSSLNAETEGEKRRLFEGCLSDQCQYMDPIVSLQGWDELASYMLAFREAKPGHYFVTTQFWEHHDASIARWELRSGDDETAGEGASFGRYNREGKLLSMTGFFEVSGSYSSESTSSRSNPADS